MILMCIQNLVEFCPFVSLKILGGGGGGWRGNIERSELRNNGIRERTVQIQYKYSLTFQSGAILKRPSGTPLVLKDRNYRIME